MGKIGSVQNYSGLAGTSGTSGAGGVSGNKGQDSTKIQQGQSWYSRISSWVQNSAQPSYSLSQHSTHTPGKTEAKSGWSWGGLLNMVTSKKIFPEMNITKWSNGKASEYEARSVASLKEQNIFIETEMDDGMVMIDAIKLTADSELPSKELSGQQMHDLADAIVEDTPAPQKTAARSDISVTASSGKSATPVLDEVVSSWVQNSAQPSDSLSQHSTHTPGKTEAKSGWSSGGLQNMVTSKKIFPEMNITKWSNGRASEYEAQSVASLKEQNIFIESEMDDGMVMIDAIKLTADSELPSKELSGQQMHDLADAMVEDTPAPQKTAAKSDISVTASSGKSATPVLDEVASKWLANSRDWEASQVYKAAEEVMNQAGFGTTPKFRSKSDPDTAIKNRDSAGIGILTKFCEGAGGKERSKMTTTEFKVGFKLAVLSHASEQTNWFERIDRSLTDAGWDPAN